MPKGQHSNHPRSNRAGRWNDARMIASNGYVKIRVGRGHPLADPNGYAYEHTLIWVSAGKPRPKRGEVLKHANDVKTDSRIGNLELLTRAELNRRKNAAHEKDPRGRLLSRTISTLLRSHRGAIRFHFLDKGAA